MKILLLKPSYPGFIHMNCCSSFFHQFSVPLHIAVKIPKFRFKVMPCSEDVENPPSFIELQRFAPECKH